MISFPDFFGTTFHDITTTGPKVCGNPHLRHPLKIDEDCWNNVLKRQDCAKNIPNDVMLTKIVMGILF